MNRAGMPELVVTGGFGRVGRMLVPRLIEAYRVHVVDRAEADARIPYDRVTLGDVGDPEFMTRALRSADAVLHLAADPNPAAPWGSAVANVDMTHSVLAAARETPIEHVVLASSVHAAGGWFRAGAAPVPVDGTPRPCCDYGVGKLAGEAMARLRQDTEGGSVRVLRLGMSASAPSSRDSAKTWLGDDDAADLVQRSLRADAGFGVYFGVSVYASRFWDVTSAHDDLGWSPRQPLDVPIESLPSHEESGCPMFLPLPLDADASAAHVNPYPGPIPSR